MGPSISLYAKNRLYCSICCLDFSSLYQDAQFVDTGFRSRLIVDDVYQGLSFATIGCWGLPFDCLKRFNTAMLVLDR